MSTRKRAKVERLQVDNARTAGWSWADIARGLGTSRQYAQRRYGVTEEGVA